MTRARKLTTAVLLVLALVGGGLFYLNSNLDAIVARLIEEHGSAATATDVRVSGVEIGLREARAAVNGLSVANPDGYSGGNAIELGGFSITIDPASVTGDTIVLKDVTVKGARLNLLQQGSSSNLQALLDNLGAGGSGGGDSGDGGKKLIIERFTLEGASAYVSVPALDEEREVSLPTIVLNDLGRASNGATGAAIARQILTPVIRRTLQSSAAQSLKDRAREELDRATDGLLDSVLDKVGSDDTGSN